MAKEIEVVIININKQEVIKKLKSLGAKKVFEGELTDYFFDTNDSSLKKQNKYLRLRSYASKKYVLTLKENPISKEFKIRDEYEIEVSNITISKTILKSLGYEEHKKSKKYRITYEIDNVMFDIQKIKKYPYYLEIECPNKSKIISFVKKLGFTKKDLHNYSSDEIIRQYKKLKK